MFAFDDASLGSLVFVYMGCGDYKVGIIMSKIFMTPTTKLKRRSAPYCAVMTPGGLGHFFVKNLHPIPHI